LFSDGNSESLSLCFFLIAESLRGKKGTESAEIEN